MNRRERRKRAAKDRRQRRATPPRKFYIPSTTRSFGAQAAASKMTASAANSIGLVWRGETLSIPVQPIIMALADGNEEHLYLYAQAYGNALNHAVEARGAAAFESSARQAAIHEAGHIVIGNSIGIVADWSMVWESVGRCPLTKRAVSCWGGWTESHYADGRGDFGTTVPLSQNVRVIKNMMAGYVAEDVIEPDLSREASSLDERVGTTHLCFAVAAWNGARSSEEVMTFLAQMESEVGAELLRQKDCVLAVANALLAAHPERIERQDITQRLAMPSDTTARCSGALAQAPSRWRTR
jgi:hypothetical protein